MAPWIDMDALDGSKQRDLSSLNSKCKELEHGFYEADPLFRPPKLPSCACGAMIIVTQDNDIHSKVFLVVFTSKPASSKF